MVYQNDSVIAVIGNMVNMHINAEKDTALANKYGIAGYPTIVLANSDGSEIDRIYGYAEPPDFINTINDYLADKNTLNDFLRQAQANSSLSLYYKIADKYVSRKKFTDAESYLNKILAADPENKQGYSDSALLSLGDMKMRAKDYAGSEAEYQKFLKTYPNSPMAPDALFDIGAVKRRAGNYDDAVAAFKNFIATYPKSEMVTDAELYIASCNEKKGNKDEAVRLYKQFLIDHPQSPDTSYAKAQIERITNPPKEDKK